MPILSYAVPIPPGKTEALQQHIAEAAKRADLDETFRGFGISRETWHLQETPQGDLVVLVFDAEDPSAMLAEFATSEAELPTWQRKCLKEILGIDLSDPPPGPPSRLIFEWP
jgi:hypothetical protein